MKKGVLQIFVLQLSHSWGQALGSLTLPLREVLAEPSLVLDRWFNLDGALPESQILLRVTLKVLLIITPPACSVYTRTILQGAL